MDILGYLSCSWLTPALYLLLLVFLTLSAQALAQSPFFIGLVRISIFFILIIHGIQLHESVFTAQGFVFGFAQDLSLIAWAGLAFYWFQSWFLPIVSLRWMALIFAMVCSALPGLFPGTLLSPAAVSDPWFKGHFIVATLSVGLLLSLIHI